MTLKTRNNFIGGADINSNAMDGELGDDTITEELLEALEDGVRAAEDESFYADAERPDFFSGAPSGKRSSRSSNGDSNKVGAKIKFVDETVLAELLFGADMSSRGDLAKMAKAHGAQGRLIMGIIEAVFGPKTPKLPSFEEPGFTDIVDGLVRTVSVEFNVSPASATVAIEQVALMGMSAPWGGGARSKQTADATNAGIQTERAAAAISLARKDAANKELKQAREAKVRAARAQERAAEKAAEEAAKKAASEEKPGVEEAVSMDRHAAPGKSPALNEDVERIIALAKKLSDATFLPAEKFSFWSEVRIWFETNREQLENVLGEKPIAADMLRVLYRLGKISISALMNTIAQARYYGLGFQYKDAPWPKAGISSPTDFFTPEIVDAWGIPPEDIARIFKAHGVLPDDFVFIQEEANAWAWEARLAADPRWPGQNGRMTTISAVDWFLDNAKLFNEMTGGALSLEDGLWVLSHQRRLDRVNLELWKLTTAFRMGRNSPTILALARGELSTSDDVLRFAWENKKRIFSETGSNSFLKVVRSLTMHRKVGPKIKMNQLFVDAFSFVHAVYEFEEKKPEIIKCLGPVQGAYATVVDRSKFRFISEPHQQIENNDVIAKVIRWAKRIYLGDFVVDGLTPPENVSVVRTQEERTAALKKQRLSLAQIIKESGRLPNEIMDNWDDVKQWIEANIDWIKGLNAPSHEAASNSHERAPAPYALSSVVDALYANGKVSGSAITWSGYYEHGKKLDASLLPPVPILSAREFDKWLTADIFSRWESALNEMYKEDKEKRKSRGRSKSPDARKFVPLDMVYILRALGYITMDLDRVTLMGYNKIVKQCAKRSKALGANSGAADTVSGPPSPCGRELEGGGH